jgi:hypothetical protein
MKAEVKQMHNDTNGKQKVKDRKMNYDQIKVKVKSQLNNVIRKSSKKEL